MSDTPLPAAVVWYVGHALNALAIRFLRHSSVYKGTDGSRGLWTDTDVLMEWCENEQACLDAIEMAERSRDRGTHWNQQDRSQLFLALMIYLWEDERGTYRRSGEEPNPCRMQFAAASNIDPCGDDFQINNTRSWTLSLSTDANARRQLARPTFVRCHVDSTLVGACDRRLGVDVPEELCEQLGLGFMSLKGRPIGDVLLNGVAAQPKALRTDHGMTSSIMRAYRTSGKGSSCGFAQTP